MIQPLKVTWVKGEITPKLRSNITLEQQHREGSTTLENALVEPHGPATKRAGFRYIAACKHADKDSRLLRFVFNEFQAYVLEVGDQYMRFFTQQGQIETTPGSGVAYEIATPWLEDDIWDIQAYGTQYKDVLILLHPDYAPRKLTRFDHNSWALEEIEFIDGPYLPREAAQVSITGTSGTVTIEATTNLFQVANGATPSHVGHQFRYQDPTSNLWHWISLTTIMSTVTAQGVVQGPAGFKDLSHVLSGTGEGPCRIGALGPVTGYPGSGAFYEQRLFLGGVPFRPMGVWSSQTGLELYQVFAPGSEADDGLDFTISGPADPIRWIVNHRQLAIGSAGGEFSTNKQMAPDNTWIEQQGRVGSAPVQAIVADRFLIFISRSRRKVMETAYNYTYDSWPARDIAVLAEHITRGGVKEICYQQDPNQIIWAVRQDGVLLSCTYWPTEGDGGGIIAWARQTTGASGLFKSIIVIPGIVEARDELWAIVKRTVNGSDVRYVEMLESQWGDGDGFVEMEDAFYVDSGLTYEGPAIKTITDITTAMPPVVSCAVHGFSAGNDILITGLTAPMDELVNGLHVVAASPAPTTNQFALGLVDPSEWPAYAGGGYAQRKVTKLSGLGHLEGCTVQILGDGFNLGEEAVSGASIQLDALMGVSKAQVGLGYEYLNEPLPLDGASMGRKKRVKRLGLRVHNSVGGEFSRDGETWTQIPLHRVGDPMDTPPQALTGDFPEGLQAVPLGWDTDGRILIRHRWPFPFTNQAIVGEVEKGD